MQDQQTEHDNDKFKLFSLVNPDNEQVADIEMMQLPDIRGF